MARRSEGLEATVRGNWVRRGGTGRGAGEGWGWVSGRTMAWKGGSLSAAVVTDLRVARDAWEEGRCGRGSGER